MSNAELDLKIFEAVMARNWDEVRRMFKERLAEVQESENRVLDRACGPAFKVGDEAFTVDDLELFVESVMFKNHVKIAPRYISGCFTMSDVHRWYFVKGGIEEKPYNEMMLKDLAKESRLMSREQFFQQVKIFASDFAENISCIGADGNGQISWPFLQNPDDSKSVGVDGSPE